MQTPVSWRHGHEVRLRWPPRPPFASPRLDANQVLESPDPASGQLYSTAFAAQFPEPASDGSAARECHPRNRGPSFLKTSSAPASGFPKGRLPRPWLQELRTLPPARRHRRHHRAPSRTTTPIPLAPPPSSPRTPSLTNKGLIQLQNALLFTLQKNLSHGLQFDFNYTFAHFHR